MQLSDRVWCGSQGDFAGVVDLVKMKAIMWKSENLGTAPLLFVARVHLRSFSLRECIMGVPTRQRTRSSLSLSLTHSLLRHPLTLGLSAAQSFLQLGPSHALLREYSYEWCCN